MNPTSPMGDRRSLLLLLCFFLFLLIALISSNGCSWLIAPPESDTLALRQVARWTDHNKELKQFKGLFRVRAETREQSLNVRAALAAVVPDHMRVELLNLLGQPLLSLASDGDHIFVLDIADQKFYRLKQSPTALEPFIHVPLGIDALLDTLSGRPALPPYTAAQAASPPDGALIIAFKNRWNNLVADLRLDANGYMERLRRYNPDGTIQYETRWFEWRTLQGYMIPGKISVASGSGEQVIWSVERLWPDVSIPPSIFVLAPPP